MDGTTYTYERLYTSIVQQEQTARQKLGRVFPFTGSVWRQHLRQYNKQRRDRPLRSSFLSGGTIHISLDEYRASLPQRAQDIENHVILTDVEIAHNSEGIRCFFELDYRSHEQLLPSIRVVECHLTIILQVIQDCFPGLHDTPKLHIAVCDAKRKPPKQTGTLTQLAWGVHVVCHEVITTTPILKKIAQLADHRISLATPEWSAVVDDAVYRADTATLRNCYSHKMVACEHCSYRKSDTTGCEECFHGKYVHPSIYRYYGQFSTAGFHTQSVSILEELLRMCIMPTQLAQFTTGFRVPPDMCDDIDVGRKPLPKERQTMKMIARRKFAETLSLAQYRAGVTTLSQFLGDVNEEYRHLTIHSIQRDLRTRTITAMVRGRGARYCPYKNAVHTSNRVYFTLSLKRSSLYINCFDLDCQSQTRVEHPLTYVLKRQLMEEFQCRDVTPTTHSTTTTTITTTTTTTTTTTIPMLKKARWEQLYARFTDRRPGITTV